MRSSGGYWARDPDTDLIIREAFDMKLAGHSDRIIANFLKRSDIKKVAKSSKKESYPNEKSLWKLWIDPFYYGIWDY